MVCHQYLLKEFVKCRPWVMTPMETLLLDLFWEHPATIFYGRIRMGVALEVIITCANESLYLLGPKIHNKYEVLTTRP